MPETGSMIRNQTFETIDIITELVDEYTLEKHKIKNIVRYADHPQCFQGVVTMQKIPISTATYTRKRWMFIQWWSKDKEIIHGKETHTG